MSDPYKDVEVILKKRLFSAKFWQAEASEYYTPDKEVEMTAKWIVDYLKDKL